MNTSDTPKNSENYVSQNSVFQRKNFKVVLNIEIFFRNIIPSNIISGKYPYRLCTISTPIGRVFSEKSCSLTLKTLFREKLV